jgi:hypothetical protein
MERRGGRQSLNLVGMIRWHPRCCELLSTNGLRQTYRIYEEHARSCSRKSRACSVRFLIRGFLSGAILRAKNSKGKAFRAMPSATVRHSRIPNALEKANLQRSGYLVRLK